MATGDTGRWILSAVAATTAVGGYLADWNHTHLFNPRWPPHAKFHDAQTIALGSILGCGGLFLLWRRKGEPEMDLALGALLPASFWIAQGISYAFPGAAGLDAEFPNEVPRIAGVRVSEWMGSSLMLMLTALGYWLERRQLPQPRHGSAVHAAPGRGRPGLHAL
jgi:hypothetical protein